MKNLVGLAGSHGCCGEVSRLCLCCILGATVVQEVEKSFSNQKVASSIPCRSVLEQDTEPLTASDVQCAISVKCKMCVHCKSHICKSLWIKASAKCKYNLEDNVLLSLVLTYVLTHCEYGGWWVWHARHHC